MLYKKTMFRQNKTLRREFVLVACCALPFIHAQEANQAKSIRDGNPEQTEQTSKSLCLPAVAANCSLRLATQCHSKDSNEVIESKQLDTRLAQYLRHKSTVSLPPNLTERSLNHFIPALRLLKPHVKKNNISQNLLAPEWRTLFEECQFFLQECQIKFFIPSRISRKYQTLGNDYSASNILKSCTRICPSKSRAITKLAIAQLKETVLLFWQTKQEQVLILHSLLNHKPNQALAALGATAHNKLSQLVMNQKHSASSFCERRPKLLRKRPPLS